MSQSSYKKSKECILLRISFSIQKYQFIFYCYPQKKSKPPNTNFSHEFRSVGLEHTIKQAIKQQLLSWHMCSLYNTWQTRKNTVGFFSRFFKNCKLQKKKKERKYQQQLRSSFRDMRNHSNVKGRFMGRKRWGKWVKNGLLETQKH